MTRAQSETLGFVFVFALIALTVGTVYALGVPTIQDAQNAERINNMERAFEVLDDNVDDVARSGAPGRATEVKLAGGSLSISESTEITVHATNTTNAADNASFSVVSRPISYSDGEGTSVAYDGGALVRSDDGAATLDSAPNWVIDDERSVIPLLVTYPATDRTSLGGRTTVLVVTERKTNTLAGAFQTPSGSDARVNVTITSPYAEAWATVLSEKGMTALDADATDDTIKYQFETDTLYVPRTSIAVTLAR